MNSDIFQKLITQKDSVELSEDISKVLEEIESNPNLSQNQIISKYIKIPYLDPILSLVEEKGIESLGQLLKQIQDIEIAKVTLSFYPTKDQAEKMLDILKNNLNDTFFLEVEVDPSIIGGAIVYFKGIYKDYSVKKMLETKSLN